MSRKGDGIELSGAESGGEGSGWFGVPVSMWRSSGGGVIGD